jgi:hypothetical protein
MNNVPITHVPEQMNSVNDDEQPAASTSTVPADFTPLDSEIPSTSTDPGPVETDAYLPSGCGACGRVR